MLPRNMWVLSNSKPPGMPKRNRSTLHGSRIRLLRSTGYRRCRVVGRGLGPTSWCSRVPAAALPEAAVVRGGLGGVAHHGGRGGRHGGGAALALATTPEALQGASRFGGNAMESQEQGTFRSFTPRIMTSGHKNQGSNKVFTTTSC